LLTLVGLQALFPTSQYCEDLIFSLQLAKLQFKRRRIVEIQHGRVAWLQVLGLNMLNHVKTSVLSYRNRRKVVDKP
jgi:hypothetical protein